MFGLPEYLAERCELAGDLSKINSSGPVVVWLKSSFRLHENPAIDAGRLIANKLDLPIFIYHGIDDRYPHASARHHKVLLDAAVDMHNNCKKAGLDYFLNIYRKGNREKALHKLSNVASIIITDLFPVPPWKDWVKSIANNAKCPVLQIDCHCVVPMTVFGKSMDRPFRYRDATKKLRKKRIGQNWPKLQIDNRRYTSKLPFTPVDIEEEIVQARNGFDIIKSCDIDMTNHPIWSERGGENSALAKWQNFLEKGIHGYAKRRNNAADPDGVSRLSSAIHYGFISVMKIAREASDVGTKSAEKFLDELMIFREHAWHHVYSCDDPYDSNNLPQWALDSWENTSNDPRLYLLDKTQLELGRSDSELWNLCQISLLRHGELHNNLRMTWGKAIPQWTKSVEDSILMAQHLNDRYALDGRDPSSIAGVQWCHGLFDRAFYPPMPVMGVVRKRDLETHKSRLDLQRYHNHVTRTPIEQKNPIIIVGAGYSGSIAAFTLNNLGFEVIVLDKGTKPGGRSSTKIRDTGVYNHGNSKIEDLEIVEHLQDFGDNLDHADNQVTHLLKQIDVRCGRVVTKITEKADCAEIFTEKGEMYLADGVIVTCPLPQTYKLVSGLPQVWENFPYDSNWTVIITGKDLPNDIENEKLPPHIDEIRYGTGSKPQNNVIVHFTNEWSKQNLENSRQEIINKFHEIARQNFSETLTNWITNSSMHAHRWRYSRPTKLALDPGLTRIKFAGDAFSEPLGTVDGAIASGKLASLDLIWELDNLRERKRVSVQSKLF